jgi:hypothetical protein
MVRVGGGWADLGSYLESYALHHGSKAVKSGVVMHTPDTDKVAKARESIGGEAAGLDFDGPADAKSGKGRSSLGGAGLGLGLKGVFDHSPLPSKSTSRPGSALRIRDDLRPRPESSLQVRKTRKSDGASLTPLAAKTSSRSLSGSVSMPGGFHGVGGLGSATAARAASRAASGSYRADSGVLSPTTANGAAAFGELGRVGGTKRVFRKGS